MSRRVRIKDIAEKAGVSTGTVDRVIHKRGKVSDKARERVLAVMKELDYELDIIASTLASKKTLQIGVLMPDPQTDPYWAYPLRGIDKAISTVGHYGVEKEVRHFDLFDADHFFRQGKLLLEQEPDALLFPPLFLDQGNELSRLCKACGTEVAYFNTDILDQEVLTYVGQDSYQSGVLAGRLLNIDGPPLRKALVLHIGKEVTNARHLVAKEKGVRDYYRKWSNKEDYVLRYQFSDLERIEQLGADLRDIQREHPDLSGIFVTNSRAYKLLQSMEPSQIEQYRIIGFDLLPENLFYLEHNQIDFLINQNPAQQGYWGVLNLVNSLLFKKSVPRLMHLPLDIVVAENASYYVAREKEYIV